MSLARLQEAWRRSDQLLGLLEDPAWLARPIALRQPFLFYLGHLPAFAWNHLGRGLLRRRPFRPEFDELFERGIDPVGVDSYETRARWPARAEVLEYRDRVRRELEEALGDPGFPARGGPRVELVVEHELMHHETLLYMIQELDHALKRRPAGWPELPGPAPARTSRRVDVPEGLASLGADRGALPFGWDNEFPRQHLEVAAFAIDELPVTNAEFREFVRAGGYAEPRLWRTDDWSWRQRRRLSRPHGWVEREGQLCVRSALADVPFEQAAPWPVAVSWAEAAAYARWRGGRLPSEAEWHRAARGTPSGGERPWPWGADPPEARHGNFGFQHASGLPAGSHPAGASAWGALELVGNGWEWTGTTFGPFPGFEALPAYPGYSADFFDGAHFVLLGGSWATDRALLRSSFRNWFQPHYPYVFAKFRCVQPVA